ncbi:MAG: orotidine-5'-phosphate decarboxylase, partial [Chloroflexota bacterium]|nr:orotidine-5'-phosphate decarboxylase [Chloroflexota bacterium]
MSEAGGAVGFGGRLAAAAARAGSLVCVGLDPDPARFPAPLRGERDAARAIVRFNAAIVEATSDLVCAYKPNLGFYAAHGAAGIAALEETRRLIPPDVPAILDCKVGDIGSTAEAYARGYFDRWGFDAVTVSPYLGADSLAPFLARDDRGVFVLCKTSNPGGGDLQDLTVRDGGGERPLHLAVADLAATWATEAAATVGLVVGATYPAELAA